MSTRSVIGIVNEDGTIICIYCHNDGYPEGVGAMLKNNYTEETKIRNLLALGDISCLGKGILLEEGTRAYGRDRGEQGTVAQKYLNERRLMRVARNNYDAEYVYLWEQRGWKIIIPATKRAQGIY